MECFGYSKNNSDTLLELTEVTFRTGPEQLRILAEFLVQCAKDMENDPDWEHEHFCDFIADESDQPDIVVFKGLDKSREIDGVRHDRDRWGQTRLKMDD